jgi:hypothetical protein
MWGGGGQGTIVHRSGVQKQPNQQQQQQQQQKQQKQNRIGSTTLATPTLFMCATACTHTWDGESVSPEIADTQTTVNHRDGEEITACAQTRQPVFRHGGSLESLPIEENGA